nr:DUF190 domain-containing protein [Frankia sp. Cr1]
MARVGCADQGLQRLTSTSLLAVLLSYLCEPLASEIVHRAHRAGLAGASVFRGVEGFGASSIVHTTRLLSLSADLAGGGRCRRRPTPLFLLEPGRPGRGVVDDS